MLLCLSIHRPIAGRSNWPATNGTSSCSTMLPTVCHAEPPAALWLDTTTPTIAGVMKMPSKLDADAAQTAAGTFPRPMEVNAMEDWTVDGSVQRNRTPIYSVGVTSGVRIGLSANPSNGNN